MFSTVVLLLILLLLIGCFTSVTVRFFTKLTLYGICLIGASTIGALFCLIRGRTTNNHFLIFSIFQWSVKWMGIKIKIENAEYLDSDEPFVLIANHQAALDVYTMTFVWPENCAVVLKSSLRYVPGFNLCAYLCKSIFINRFNKERAHASISNAERAIKDDKTKIFIYPEGTRNANEGLLPFKKGAFVIAKSANVPIIPCIFSLYKPFYEYKTRKFEAGSITIRVLPPVYPDEKSVDELSDECHRLMTETLLSMNKAN